MLAHGAREPIHGVAISELKKIQKRAGGTNHALALELWDTGVYDAMYLAALLADDVQMSPRDLQRWVAGANCSGALRVLRALGRERQPGTAGRSALKWIDSRKELEAAAGWGTLGGVVAIRDDAELDLAHAEEAAGARGEGDPQRAQPRALHDERLRHRGGQLREAAAPPRPSRSASGMGKVEVDMGDTSCKVPGVVEYIGKVKARGNSGKKRKSMQVLSQPGARTVLGFSLPR